MSDSATLFSDTDDSAWPSPIWMALGSTSAPLSGPSTAVSTTSLTAGLSKGSVTRYGEKGMRRQGRQNMIVTRSWQFVGEYLFTTESSHANPGWST